LYGYVIDVSSIRMSFSSDRMGKDEEDTGESCWIFFASSRVSYTRGNGSILLPTSLDARNVIFHYHDHFYVYEHRHETYYTAHGHRNPSLNSLRSSHNSHSNTTIPRLKIGTIPEPLAEDQTSIGGQQRALSQHLTLRKLYHVGGD